MIGDRVTNNEQLYSLGKKLLSDKFIAVLPSNYAPLHPNGYMILNTDPSTKSGEHWVSLLPFGDETYFYDSFNRPFTSLSSHWKKKPWIQYIDDSSEQSISEEECGAISMAVILTFDKYGPISLQCI